MTINLEIIDELVKRTGVSYKEAKEALEKCEGDMLEAIIYLEGQGIGNNQKKAEEKCCKDSSIASKVGDIIKKGNKIDFVVSKKEKTVISLPLTIAIPVGVIIPPIAFATVAIAVFTNHKIRIEKNNGEDMKVNKVFEKISEEVSNIKNDINECTQK